MSGFENGNWHNANGGGLPFRPPTVDEALPYSPFTSIVPFSPDIIPFPSTEPPTPPTTLTPDQQSAANKGLNILNEEIKGSPSLAQHLHNTIEELETLLNPDELTEFYFKQPTQLVTPPPESSAPQANGSTSIKTLGLSPFASMLLKRTNVSYSPFGVKSSPKHTSEPASKPQKAPHPPARAPVQSQSTSMSRDAHAQNANLPYPSSASSTTTSTPARTGSIAIKALPPSGPREEYQRYDNNIQGESLSQKKREDRRLQNGVPNMRPQEREIADRKTEELRALVTSLVDERDDVDDDGNFAKISTFDSDITVLEYRALDRLSDKVSSVIHAGRFSALPVEVVLSIQSLLEPTVSATSQQSLFPKEDGGLDWSEDCEKAIFGLKASRLVLDTMIEGCDDRQICPEDRIAAVIHNTKHTLNNCIIPIVGARRTGPSSELFNTASTQKKELQTILRLCGGVLSRLAALIGKIHLSDSALTPVGYLALGLVVEQNSDSEKDSIFSIQKFELFRQKSMEVLAQIFACHHDQRSFIMTEILSNLEKLPDKRASARQFKSARDPPIMAVSALFMRFVQVAAANRDLENQKVVTKPNDDELERKKEESELIAQRLVQDATVTANTISVSLVERALNVSKTGDKPFRNLLDLFIEDFCSVLGSPEWPAAVILLRCLLSRMHSIQSADAAKQSNNNKDMALATMARMGCGIIDLTKRLKQLQHSIDVSQSDLSSKLNSLVDYALKGSINDNDLFAFDGPYRMVIESLLDYLNPLAGRDDPHLQSVSRCHTTLWLYAFNQAFSTSEESQPRSVVQLRERLGAMITDPKWLSREDKFQDVSEHQSKLAAGIIALQDPFCKQLQGIVNLLLNLTKDHSSSKLRSRGMSALEQLIERDPMILKQNEHVIMSMIRMLSDTSPLVRDSTLSLVSKCIGLDASLEQHFLKHIIARSTDPSVAPKKKAIKLLKEIYMKESDGVATTNDNKMTIAVALLAPSQDEDKAVAELTRQALEEMWLGPFGHGRMDENKLRRSRSDRASMLTEIVQRIQNEPTRLEAFEKFFASALSSEAKNSATHLYICKELVAEMIDGVISSDSTLSDNSQSYTLQALSIFAKVNPTLFEFKQIELLKTYVKDLASIEELATLRPTVTIFRYVFGSLPSIQEGFAEEVRGALQAVVGRLASWAAQGHTGCKLTLVDVVHCLWIVSQSVPLGLRKLFALVSSSLCQIQPFIPGRANISTASKKIISYLILLGTFGKICNIDQHRQLFHEVLSASMAGMVRRNQATNEDLQLLRGFKATDAVSVLFLDTVRHFTKPSPWDMNIREQALCSVGEICQQSPSLFTRAEVEKTFKLVFINEDNSQLKRVVLAQFNDYFCSAERRSESGAAIAVGEGAATGAARLGNSFVASDNDTATLHMGRAFLPHIVKIALEANNELAFLATETICSISRQGLVHPKECGPPLIALETSPNTKINEMAFAEHQKIHLAHETMFEKEYMSAIRMAFDYQRDVFNDTHGMIRSTANDTHGMLRTTYRPKLAHLFEVLKAGNRKTLKKFIENIGKQIDFELSKLDVKGENPDALLYARFCLENLSLLDYQRLEDVAILLNALEGIVLKHTGPAVALAIETEMPKQHSALPEQQLEAAMDEGTPSIPAPFALSQDPTTSIDDTRLRQITTACMILQMMWETRTFVRRCYNLHNLIGRVPQKDYSRPAQRNNFVPGKELFDKLLPIMASLNNRESMFKQCYDFAELLEVDREAKIGEDDDGNGVGAGYETPDENAEAGEGLNVPTSGKGRKRKSNVNISNTPKKARGRSMGSKKKRSSKTPEDSDDY